MESDSLGRTSVAGEARAKTFIGRSMLTQRLRGVGKFRKSDAVQTAQDSRYAITMLFDKLFRGGVLSD